MFENAFDECQFGCGFVANLLELKSHENDCLLVGKYECQIIGCPVEKKKNWNRFGLIMHVQEQHKNAYVNLSSTDFSRVRVGPNVKTLLVTRYHHGNKFNEVFWLKYSIGKEKKLITFQHLCDFGIPDKGNMKISEFQVTSASRPLQNITYKMQGLEYYKSSVDVTILSGNSYQFKVINPSQDSLLSLKCLNCSNTTRELFNCNDNHSFCEKCAQGVSCPSCGKHISKKCNLGNSSGDIEVGCKYKGCTFKDIKVKTDAHENECDFQTSKCGFQCNWEGLYCDIYKHWWTKHLDWRFENKQSNLVRTWSRISADNFMLTIILKLFRFSFDT